MAKIKINNIVSATLGATQHEGIKSISATIVKGEPVPDMDEGNLYPTGVDNVGVREGFPVRGQLTYENMTTGAALLAAATADLVVVGNAHGSNTDQEFTFENCQFFESKDQMQRQRDGESVIDFVCFSDDGTTLPYSVGNAS